MDIKTLKTSLSDLLGLPYEAVLEAEGKLTVLSYMAFQELEGMLSLPEGFSMTHNISVPKEGEYFLDLSSLISEDRVIIYLATGKVHTSNLILTKSKKAILPEQGKFDLLMCMLSGGKASYEGAVVQLLAPIIDSTDSVSIIDADGSFKVVPLSELKNILTSPGYKGGNGGSKYGNRLSIYFDDEGFDPWNGLN